MTLKNIQSDFEFLDEWEDRYRYISSTCLTRIGQM